MKAHPPFSLGEVAANALKNEKPPPFIAEKGGEFIHTRLFYRSSYLSPATVPLVSNNSVNWARLTQPVFLRMLPM